MIAIKDCSWPMARASEAMQALARHASLPCRSPRLPSAPPGVLSGNQEACRAWIECTAACLGLQIERRAVTYGDLARLSRCGPSLMEINLGGETRLLAVVGSGQKHCLLLPPGRKPVRSAGSEFRTIITDALVSELKTTIADLLAQVGVKQRLRAQVLQRMLEEHLGDVPVTQLWHLELVSSASVWVHARRAGMPGKLAMFFSAQTVEYGLWILSWALVGRWALGGSVDNGWLIGWALILMTLIPIHMFGRWLQARLVIAGGAILMRLLLEGSFKLKVEQIRNQGVGQLLGRVLESEALQSLALTGGLSALTALIQLAVGVVLFALTGSTLISLLTLLAIPVIAGLGLQYHHRRRLWTNSRLEITQELIERIIGHRTRLVQQPPERRHEGEDDCLARYVEQSRSTDRLAIVGMAVVPRCWVMGAVAAMAPGIISGKLDPAAIGSQVGIIMLAHTALRTLSSSLASLSGAAIAAERCVDFLRAARIVEAPGDPAVAASAFTDTGNLLEMRGVTYRYPGRATDTIRHAFLQVERGDRILLQGASGGGKSTLVAMASGLRVPDSGLLFLAGIDRGTMGDREWRRHVVAAPQSHENHVFTGSLAYNLLLGRGWPAGPEDLTEADEICRELGLGPLLDRMPGGLMQIVGETGWQLSNGEKNRVYLARALLQRSDMVLLDETCAALDPETAQHVIDCVRRRAPTLLCVAHV
jgi:ATP-binding cassette, subfamily B, bacterial